MYRGIVDEAAFLSNLILYNNFYNVSCNYETNVKIVETLSSNRSLLKFNRTKTNRKLTFIPRWMTQLRS